MFDEITEHAQGNEHFLEKNNDFKTEEEFLRRYNTYLVNHQEFLKEADGENEPTHLMVNHIPLNEGLQMFLMDELNDDDLEAMAPAFQEEDPSGELEVALRQKLIRLILGWWEKELEGVVKVAEEKEFSLEVPDSPEEPAEEEGEEDQDSPPEEEVTTSPEDNLPPPPPPPPPPVTTGPSGPREIPTFESKALNALAQGKIPFQPPGDVSPGQRGLHYLLGKKKVHPHMNQILQQMRERNAPGRQEKASLFQFSGEPEENIFFPSDTPPGGEGTPPLAT